MTAGSIQWLEDKVKELLTEQLAEHDKKCAERVKTLEVSLRDAGEQVMTLVKENAAVRGDLSQALAERNNASEDATRIAEELHEARAEIARLNEAGRDMVAQLSTQAHGESILKGHYDDLFTAHGRALAALRIASDENAKALTRGLGAWAGTTLQAEIDAILAGPMNLHAPEAWRALIDVLDERRRQDEQWGGTDHDDEHAPGEWCDYIQKQLDLAGDGGFRGRMVKVAALAVAAIESHDRLMTSLAAARVRRPVVRCPMCGRAARAAERVPGWKCDDCGAVFDARRAGGKDGAR